MEDAVPTPTGGQQHPRLSVEEEIASRHMEATKEDYTDFPTEDRELEVAPEPVEAAPEPEVSAASDNDTVSPPADPAPPKMLSIVVDGQTIEVEESRILEAGKRTLQKLEAADKKLQEAVRKEREADERLRRVQNLQPSTDAAPPQQAPSQDAPPSQQLSPEALDSYLENKLYMRDAHKAATKFREDFPDIAGDQNLMNLAIQMENQRLGTVTALGESFGDPFEAYRKHGEEIRKWTAKFQGTTTPANEDKQERKRTITAVSAANAVPPAPKPARELTVAEIIAQERKAREGRPVPR